MNNLLHLKGRFEQEKYNGKPNGRKLPSGSKVNVSKLEKLKNDLINLKDFWLEQKLFSGALTSVYYTKIAAKSNRIQGLLSKGSQKSNDSVVGARFTKSNSPRHIITHYVSMEIINESIIRLENSIKILNEKFNGQITHEQLKNLTLDFKKFSIAKTHFNNLIIDAHYVEKISVLIDDVDLKKDSIVTIYQTDVETTELMEKLGISLQQAKIMDGTTILLRPEQLELLKQKAPYLISMAVSDLTKLSNEDFEFDKNTYLSIPPYKDEPTIGVIDTMFDKSVYFSEWVEFKNMLDKNIPLEKKDYIHGTAVSSIIVDGPTFNPQLNDNCGRFRVRHFGVAAGNQFSSFTILRNINEIISSNRDIKVWNLSLGSNLEINPNFISPEAAILDNIQSENDVIFIVAGTNNGNDKKMKAIGAPADSINSLVVNSVTIENKPASYTRKGPVLSFFTKPDISYYGGDKNNRMRVCSPNGELFVTGTSFAAPWIARKMSYLIDILGFSREVAKALIINSATGWEKQEVDSILIGHGIVPIKIDDIIRCQDDEIQFILYGISEKYDTYNYNIPVPVTKEKHPFIAKATLCYFPSCSRYQGVDYTNTELDISFGPLGESISTINSNYQSDEVGNFTWESDARKLFRKWDNVKHIREVFTTRKRSKKAYSHGLWGISLKTKERLDEKYGENLKFAVIITLKEINGLNRIDEFIKNCYLRGWLVNEVEIENRLDIYNTAENEVVFDE